MKKKIELLLVLVLLATSVRAQFVPAPAPAQRAPLLIQGGTLHVGNGQVLASTDVLIENGKITRIAVGIAAPAGAQVVNAAGKHVYPGLIALNSTLGLVEIGAVRATDDQGEVGPYNPNVRAIVGYNTDSHIPPTVRANGVLYAQVVPQNGTLSGTSSLVQLDAWSWEDAAVAMDEGLVLRWPSMRPQGGDARAQQDQRDRIQRNLQALQQWFTDAYAYAQAKKGGQNPAYDIRLEALQPYLNQGRRVYCYANEASQIEAAVQFALQNKLRISIVGGYQALQVAALLREHQIPVILNSTHNLPQNQDEDYDLPFKQPKQLRDAGITVAIGVDGSSWQAFNLPFYAGTAAAFGLTPEEALACITLDAAKAMGQDARLGSIEVGKEGSVVVSTGDILDMRTSVIEYACIQGRSISLTNKFTTLYERFKQKYERK